MGGETWPGLGGQTDACKPTTELGLDCSLKKNITPSFIPRIVFFLLNSSQSLAIHSQSFMCISSTQGSYYNVDFQTLSLDIQKVWGGPRNLNCFNNLFGPDYFFSNRHWNLPHP